MEISKKSYWTHYTLELVVVFLGVTTGFLLNTWREKSSESELEKKYLTSFYDDILIDEETLDSLIIRSQTRSEKLMHILKSSADSKIPLLEKQAKEIVNEILTIEWFSPSDDTYEDIKNSGNLNIIADYNLKRQISSYYEFQKELKKGEQYYLDHMNNYVFPLLYKKYVMHERKFLNKKSYQSIEFSNMYIALTAFINQNINSYIELKEKNENLKKDFSKTLNIDAL